jgi:hypothetical protein
MIVYCAKMGYIRIAIIDEFKKIEVEVGLR